MAYVCIVAVVLAHNEALTGQREILMTPAAKAEATIAKLQADGIQVDMKHFAKIPGFKLPVMAPPLKGMGMVESNEIAAAAKAMKVQAKAAAGKKAYLERKNLQDKKSTVTKQEHMLELKGGVKGVSAEHKKCAEAKMKDEKRQKVIPALKSKAHMAKKVAAKQATKQAAKKGAKKGLKPNQALGERQKVDAPKTKKAKKMNKEKMKRVDPTLALKRLRDQAGKSQ